MGKFNYFINNQKRIQKISQQEQEDLVFDLINAFSLTRSPADSALLLQDLLTETEVVNLAKRLRIAKLILAGQTHQEIVESLHASYATVSKVNIWLGNSGQGLRNIIQKLPNRKKVFSPKKTPGVGYPFSEILLSFASLKLKEKEQKQLNKFLAGMKSKTSIDRDLREETNASFRESKLKRNKE